MSGLDALRGYFEERDARLAHQRDSLVAEVARRTLELNEINERLQQDLAQNRKAVVAVQESRIHMRDLLDASSEYVLLLDPVGEIPAINAFGAARFGQLPETITGKNFFSLLPPIWRRSGAR